MIKKRLFIMPKGLRVLFLLQALAFFSAGLGILLLVLNDHDVPLSAMDDLVLPFCAAAMLTLGVGSSLAVRSKSRRDVELLIRMQIALCTTAALVFVVVMFLRGVSAALLVSILAWAGIGGMWICIYFKNRKEVKRPGINIKEF